MVVCDQGRREVSTDSCMGVMKHATSIYICTYLVSFGRDPTQPLHLFCTELVVYTAGAMSGGDVTYTQIAVLAL